MTNNFKKKNPGTVQVIAPLVGAGVFIAALVTSVVAYEIYDDKTQTIQTVRRDLRELSVASSMQLKNTLDSASLVLSSAARDSLPFLSKKQAFGNRLSERFQEIQVGTSVNSLFILNENGEQLLASPSTSPGPSGDINASIIDSVRHAIPGKTVIVGPFQSMQGGDAVTYAAQNITRNDGVFLGAVVTEFDIQKAAFVGNVASQRQGVVAAVVNRDTGRLIARFPDPGILRLLRPYSSTSLFKRFYGKNSGEFSAISEVDGIRREMSFHRVGDYPLVSIAEMDEDVANNVWHENAIHILVVGYLSLSVVILLLFTIHRQLNRLVSKNLAIKEGKQRFDRVIHQLTDGIYVRDEDGLIVVANKRFAQFFGKNCENEIIGTSILDLLPCTTKEIIRKFNEEVFACKENRFVIENDTVTISGAPIPVEYTLSAIEIAGSQHILGQVRDVSARKVYESQLVRQATVDEITMLPNRRLFMDRLSHALHHSKRFGLYTAVLFIDLDHFKRINDTLGHPYGDQLLVLAAHRLTAVYGESNTVARFGGDEFAILVPGYTDERECRRFAEQTVVAFQAPFSIAGRSVSITASVGVAVAPTDGEDEVSLLQHADTAMYEAKAGGRNTFRFFDHEMNDRVHEMLQIDELIRTALANDEITVIFQPIIDPVTGIIVKAEALARWNNKTLGLVSPDKFIPVAEENGVISAIGEWVLLESCCCAAEWAKTLPYPVTVSVNVSAKQLDDPTFIDTVFSALSASGLPPHLLELEMTERILISENEVSLETIDSLKEMGVGLSLDDFGTGYSSLSYLTKFPLNTLKIDRTFIRDLGHDVQIQKLTMAIISLAKSLGLKLVAEGVETKAQAGTLVSYGCDFLQGYYYGQPMTSQSLIDLGGITHLE